MREKNKEDGKKGKKEWKIVRESNEEKRNYKNKGKENNRTGEANADSCFDTKNHQGH